MAIGATFNIIGKLLMNGFLGSNFINFRPKVGDIEL
jgi:hypothetical protein